MAAEGIDNARIISKSDQLVLIPQGRKNKTPVVVRVAVESLTGTISLKAQGKQMPTFWKV